MRRSTVAVFPFLASLGLFFGIGSSAPTHAAAPQQKLPPIIQHSEWDMGIFHGGVVKQDAFLRIDGGVIFAYKSNAPAGRAFIDDTGKLRIIFRGHRKIGNGEAVLIRKGPGHWEGQVAFPSSTAGIRLKKK